MVTTIASSSLNLTTIPPVAGSAICRFESAQMKGKPIIVIRLVKILEPLVVSPETPNFPPLREGDLLRGKKRTWHYKTADGEWTSTRNDCRRGLRYLKEYPEASFDYIE
ncbi:hypothetical protein PHLCEN_2v7918 [Hermanssonia centrifuga]|uniref:Uncharacterized protein n=1 Tax=Hermanssonia centrifuga TaxID=98765 RepID=A0A2R6NV58_9APHY|nr:hypothetical protein PHLCEN_2v7918 [Hermanssonia centrifuga]